MITLMATVTAMAKPTATIMNTGMSTDTTTARLPW